MAEYTDLMPASAISTIIHLDKSNQLYENSEGLVTHVIQKVKKGKKTKKNKKLK